ncbi:MAG: PAS and helix-turn-helix domain-containing protein [Cohaesibacter sp.]|jgi:PAS domain S-box-containing protein|nr:PAS and helix-turn-helix domain-containing protein [Cohaesibacter sp.]
MDELASLAFENAPIGLIVTHERVIRISNLRFAEMFGYRTADLEGRSLSQLYPSCEEFLRIGELGREKMLGTGRYSDERIMRKRDGTLFWCRVRGQSLTPDEPFHQAIWSFADLSATRPVTNMTQRERQVATLMTEGKTSKEIARDLGISPRTVDVHRARLMDKFNARNSLELIAHLSGIPL